MKINKLRFLILSLLILCLCSLSSAAEAGKVPYSESLPVDLAHVLSDTAREGDPLIRPATGTYSVSRRSVLASAFEMLGWGHELSLAEKLCQGQGLACLSRFTNPCPPQVFLDFPDGNLAGNDLTAILDWIRACRESIAWDLTLSGGTARLRIHRDGIALPGNPWEIRLQENLDESGAFRELHELSSTGFPVALRKTGQDLYSLVVGPFATFTEAGKTFAALPPFPGMHLAPAPVFPGESPLFWAAILTDDLESIPLIRFASETGTSRADLSALAAAFGAEAGINGGFFSGQLPIGTLVVEGALLRGPQWERSAIGLGRGTPPVFGNGFLSLLLEGPLRGQLLDRFNELPRENEISIFIENGHFPLSPLPESGDFLAVPVTVEIRGSLSLAPQKGTLIARGTKAEVVRGLLPGMKVEVLAQWKDPALYGRDLVLQAGPRLLENGVECSAPEAFDEKTRLLKHPRTFVGWDGRSTWWTVVDGRNPSHSLGLTLQETAGLARSLGLTDAMNLDGGGSSSLWWQGSLINLPSDGKERPLPYAILFGIPSSPGSLLK